MHVRPYALTSFRNAYSCSAVKLQAYLSLFLSLVVICSLMIVILLCITVSFSFYSCGSLMQSKITLMVIMLCSLESMMVDITCLIIAILASTCTSILPQIGSVSKPPGSERQGERRRLEQTGDRRRLSLFYGRTDSCESSASIPGAKRERNTASNRPSRAPYAEGPRGKHSPRAVPASLQPRINFSLVLPFCFL